MDNVLKYWGVTSRHIHSLFQMHSLVSKTATDTEFPTSQDISVGIYGIFLLKLCGNLVIYLHRWTVEQMHQTCVFYYCV